MAWTGKTFNVGDILTAAQMNNLQADITAQANADSGAPAQQNASLALFQTAVFSSTTLGAGGSYDFPAGIYTLSLPYGGSSPSVIQYKTSASSFTIVQQQNSPVGGFFVVQNSGDLRVTLGAGGSAETLAYRIHG